MPLLAGAGIVGIAIGFGAQTLVRDFLSGFMVILEDLIRVGDVVTIAGHAGLVERITIRKVELRDLEGVVHTVPFSEITIIENRTKEYSCYVLDVGVAYREDTDAVVELLEVTLDLDILLRRHVMDAGPDLIVEGLLGRHQVAQGAGVEVARGSLTRRRREQVVQLLAAGLEATVAQHQRPA